MCCVIAEIPKSPIFASKNTKERAGEGRPLVREITEMHKRGREREREERAKRENDEGERERESERRGDRE